jgi:CRP-like cAMP-binding protein
LVLRQYPAGEAIYIEGTPGDAMYVVDSGEVRMMDSQFADAQLLERLRSGDSFGEMALLTGRTRAECCRAVNDVTAWVLYKSDFDDVMVQYPEISVSLSRAITQRLSSNESDFVIRHLRRINLFSSLAASELGQISSQVHGLRFRPGEIVCFSGQPAHSLYMIEVGEVKRTGMGPNGEPITIDVLGPGDSFGEQAIVQRSPYNTTVQALTQVELWTIGQAEFLSMMEQYPALALTVTRSLRVADQLSRAQPFQQPRHAPRRPSPRGPAPMPPRSTGGRANTPPPPRRVQQPPSGARPIKTVAPVRPPKSPREAITPSATRANAPSIGFATILPSTLIYV